MNNPLTYSKRHTTTLSWLFLFALLMFVYRLILGMKGLKGYSIDEENSTMRIVLNQGPIFLFTIINWMAIGWVTKERIGAAVALLIKLVFLSYLLYHTFGVDDFHPESNHRFWISLAGSTLAYLAFGLLHFKDKRGLYVVLTYLVIMGLSYSSNYYAFYNVINPLFDLVGLENIFEIRVSTGEHSYRTVNLFALFVNALLMPFYYLVFFFIYDRIKQEGKFDWTLRTAVLPETMSRATYSMMYWALRIPLFVAAFGVMSFISSFMQRGSTLQLVLVFVCYLIGIYVAASFYRNFLSSFFITRGRYPSWWFWLLNVPILHFFIWLISLTFSPYREKTDPDMSPEEGGLLQRVEKLKNNFRYFGNNQAIKILIILFMIGSSILQLDRLGLRIDGESSEGAIMLLVYFLFSLSFMVWYLYDRRAMFFLFVLQALVILVGVFTEARILMRPAVMAVLVNLVVFYAMFHFDHLKFQGVENSVPDPVS